MNRIRSTRRLAVLALLGVGMVGATALASCGDDESSAAGIAISDAWARSSPMNAANGAAYMVIVSSVDDNLLSAAVDASVAAKVELHETVASETSMTPSTEMGGGTGMTPTTMPGGQAMEMRPVDKIALKADTPTMLQPGGYHVMLLDLVAPLQVGTTFKLTLTFEKAGAKTINVPVRDAAP